MAESEDNDTDVADEVPPAPSAGEIVFGGSRFVRWTIGPAAALAAVGMSTNLFSGTLTETVLRFGVVAILGALTLGVLVPRLGPVLGRVVALGVFVACCLYVVDMFSTDNAPTSGARSEPSRANAILAMLVFGLPSLGFAVRRAGPRPPAGKS